MSITEFKESDDDWYARQVSNQSFFHRMFRRLVKKRTLDDWSITACILVGLVSGWMLATIVVWFFW